MRSVFLANLKHNCTNPGFFLGILAIPVLIFLSQVDRLAELLREGEALYYGYGFQFLQDGLSGDSIRFVLPVLCALPCSAGFVDDKKSGAIKGILPRCGRMNYVWGKILACSACGCLTILLGIVLAGGISVFGFSFWEAEAMEGENLQRGILAVVPQLFLMGLSGGLWAAVGMLISSLTGSRYVAFLSPFISYYLLIILYERYFDKLHIIYPLAWLDPFGGLPYGFWGAAIWVLEIWLFVILGFVLLTNNRLANL